jgi:periplasmic copper chaperone A
MKGIFMRRLAIFAAVVIAILVATVTPAFAHVTVSAPGATRGGSDQVITFRVPTESATASTVGVKVQFPTDTPLASVLVQAQAGWVNKETNTKLATPIKTDDGDITEAVSEIDWTLTPGAKGIAPGEFGEFIVIAGQLPDAPSLTFKAIQTYSDGSTVSWIQTQAPGSTADLEDPAPVLTLDAASPSASPSATPQASTHSNGSQTVAVVLSIIALVVAVGAAGLAFTRGRGRRAS